MFMPILKAPLMPISASVPHVTPRPLKVGIVGAGLAGLACAEALAAQGASVVLFDKGRGPGGRMSVRRLETPLGTATFDFGTQYFTARDPGFRAQVERWAEQGIVARWHEANADAWVGLPAMNAPLRALAERHDTRFSHRVEGMVHWTDGWTLMGGDFHAELFDAVALAIPPEQAAPLLSLHAFELAQAAMQVRSQPCWTLMAAFPAPLPLPDVLRDTGAISWAARNSAKPGRDGPESWVVQAAPHWSAHHLEDPADSVGEALLAALQEAAGADLPAPLVTSVHRWRYGLSAGTDLGTLWSADARIGACGDWLLGPRVECAWISGQALASRILADCTVDAETA
ncbi:MAG: hypothetical protein RIS94_1168 [Pseudomonadota bacterium]|jgi:predicted NAD/FAD-dependent oxidoreductase